MPCAFVDTHLHVWNPERLSYGWLEQAPAVLNQVREPAQIETDAKASGLSRAILVQAANLTDEMHYLLEQAEYHEWIAGVVGWVDLQNPATAATQLREFAKNPQFKGVRHLIHTEEIAPGCFRRAFYKALPLLADYDLTFDVVGTNLAHLTAAQTVARQIPSLRLVLNHLNQPPLDLEGTIAWKNGMREIAACPNVTAKISGLGTAWGKEAAWTGNDIRPWLQVAVDTFGANRLMLGSDWPVCLLAGTYRHALDQYQTEILSLVSEPDAELIFSTNAKRVYRL